jgi:hypothetical protein
MIAAAAGVALAAVALKAYVDGLVLVLVSAMHQDGCIGFNVTCRGFLAEAAISLCHSPQVPSGSLKERIGTKPLLRQCNHLYFREISWTKDCFFF